MISSGLKTKYSIIEIIAITLITGNMSRQEKHDMVNRDLNFEILSFDFLVTCKGYSVNLNICWGYFLLLLKEEGAISKHNVGY